MARINLKFPKLTQIYFICSQNSSETQKVSKHSYRSKFQISIWEVSRIAPRSTRQVIVNVVQSLLTTTFSVTFPSQFKLLFSKLYDIHKIPRKFSDINRRQQQQTSSLVSLGKTISSTSPKKLSFSPLSCSILGVLNLVSRLIQSLTRVEGIQRMLISRKKVFVVG